MPRFATAALFVVSVTAAPVALGQNAVGGPPGIGVPRGGEQPPHAALGLELSFLLPRGDFAPGRELPIGYGVRGAVGLGRRGAVDIGAAFRSVAHDSHTYGDSVEVKNMLRTLSLSGRVALPIRLARPYLGASIGAAYFGTETMVEQCCDDEGDPEWVLDDFEHVTLSPMASTRVGVLVDLSGYRSRQPVLSLDLGLENHYGGTARYQVGGRGDLRRSGTSYRVYSLGLTVRTR